MKPNRAMPRVFWVAHGCENWYSRVFVIPLEQQALGKTPTNEAEIVKETDIVVFVNLIVGQKFDRNRSDYFQLIDFLESNGLCFYGWLGWFSFFDSVIKKKYYFIHANLL